MVVLSHGDDMTLVNRDVQLMHIDVVPDRGRITIGRSAVPPKPSRVGDRDHQHLPLGRKPGSNCPPALANSPCARSAALPCREETTFTGRAIARMALGDTIQIALETEFLGGTLVRAPRQTQGQSPARCRRVDLPPRRRLTESQAHCHRCPAPRPVTRQRSQAGYLRPAEPDCFPRPAG